MAYALINQSKLLHDKFNMLLQGEIPKNSPEFLALLGLCSFQVLQQSYPHIVDSCGNTGEIIGTSGEPGASGEEVRGGFHFYLVFN